MAKTDTLNEKIRAIREAIGESQEQMAVRLGIHRVTLAKIETGSPCGPVVAAKLDAFLSTLQGTT